MSPERKWKRGDEYWALWIGGEDDHYFARFEGHVIKVHENIVWLSSGSWRYRNEGLPFKSQRAARAFIDRHPILEKLGPAAPSTNADVAPASGFQLQEDRRVPTVARRAPRFSPALELHAKRLRPGSCNAKHEA
jgi:hypothetical protein